MERIFVLPVNILFIININCLPEIILNPMIIILKMQMKVYTMQ